MAAVVDPEQVVQQVEHAFIDHFGWEPARASVSFVGVEPIEVLRFDTVPGERVYCSLGMARRPMTPSTQVVQDPHAPRAELMLHVRDDADVWRRLAVLAAAPAVEGVVYQPDMSVDLGEPLAPGSLCTGVVVENSPIAPVPTDAGTVTVLQVVPATSAELAWCRVRGSAALRARWSERATDLLDVRRHTVELG